MQYLNPFIYLFIWLETYASRFHFVFCHFIVVCASSEPRAYAGEYLCAELRTQSKWQRVWFSLEARMQEITTQTHTALHSHLHKSENHERKRDGERNREGKATQSANNKIQWILRRTLNMNTLFYVRRVKYLYGILWTKANERNGRIGWTKRQHGRSLEIDLLASTAHFTICVTDVHISLSLPHYMCLFIFHISFMHRSQSPLHACTWTNEP